MTNDPFKGVARYGVLRGGPPGQHYLEVVPTKTKKEMIWSSREGSRRDRIDAEDIDSGLQAVLDISKAAIAEDTKRASGGGVSRKSMIEAARTTQGELEAEKKGIGVRRKSRRKLPSSVDQDEKNEDVPGKSNDRSLSRSRRSIDALVEDVDSGLQAVLDIAKAAIAEDTKRASGGGTSLKSMIEAAHTIQGELDATDGKIITGDSVDDRRATSFGKPDSDGRMRNVRNAHLDGFGSKTSPILSPKFVISNKSPYQLGAYESPPYEKNRRSQANFKSSCFLPVYYVREEDRDDSEDII